VVHADGSQVTARDIVVATDASATAAILPAEASAAWASRRQKATRLVAFAATRSPLDRPVLVVSAEADGPIDNVTVPSDVIGGYAPAGAALVQVSIRDDWTGAADSLPEEVRRQAATWFGATARDWKHLATVAVPRALPDESPAARLARPRSPIIAPGLFLCGDHVASASINGALVSGRRCAEAVLGGAVRD
jgi:protoporphyrinogen oxidase